MTHALPWDFGAAEHGHRVSGYHWATPRPRGRVLLQHGYGEYAERFVIRYDEFVPAMLARGLDVYAFDMPGHGRSPGRRGSLDVRDAAALHLLAKNALAADGPVLLYGHSLGGLVAAHTAAADPDGVAGAVISSAALPTHTGWGLRAVTGMLSTVAPHAPVPLRATPVSALARPAENAEIIAADGVMYPGRLTNRTAHTALQVAADLWRLAPRWTTVPTLILHGSADRSTDPQGSVRLARAVPVDDLTLDIVDGGYHELLNDTCRREIRDRVLAWLDERTATR